MASPSKETLEFRSIIKRRFTTRQPHVRPNVSGAKVQTIGQRVEDLMATGFSISKGKRRSTVGDCCDNCKKFIRVKKSFLGLRLRGYRFACWECWQKNKYTFGGKEKMIKEESLGPSIDKKLKKMNDGLL